MDSQAQAFSWKEWARKDFHQLSEKKWKREKTINPAPAMSSTVVIKEPAFGL
jgi:hypothetical protein